jgi:hypothetical protein
MGSFGNIYYMAKQELAVLETQLRKQKQERGRVETQYKKNT